MQSLAQFEACADRLKALAEPTRLRILQTLFSGPRDVSGLSEMLDQEIVTVSHHLGVLRRIGILQTDRQGKRIVYSIAPEVGLKNSKRLNLGCCQFDLTQKK
jgi:DNA-binding transcriptional ArsR family regulator